MRRPMSPSVCLSNERLRRRTTIIYGKGSIRLPEKKSVAINGLSFLSKKHEQRRFFYKIAIFVVNRWKTLFF